MKARSPSLIDRRVLDPLLVRVGALPGRAPLPKTPPEEEPVRFAKTPSAPPKSVAEPPRSAAEAPESTTEVPDVTLTVAEGDTAPEEPAQVPGFDVEYPLIRTQAPDSAPQALDISALMSEWKYPQIVIEPPETGLEYPDIVLEAPETTAETPEPTPAVPLTTLPEIPIPGDEAQPLESRLADLLSWAIEANAATAGFVADENGLPLANRESPETLLVAAVLLSQFLERLGTLVPRPAQGSAAIGLEGDNVLQLIWVDSDRGKWAVGLVVADALASEMIRTIRATLRRVVST